jgi:aryl-alcohol dehydrogenase-like predicted oxidoreductase
VKQRHLGRTGIAVSEIGLGSMTFGSMADEATSLRILDRAFDAGVDFLDLAEIYPVPPDPDTAGASETLCGKWLAGRSRDALVIATKVAGPSGGWFRAPVREGRTALDAHNIRRAVEASLRRLRTDYIDLYQTHWPDPQVPMEATLEALDRLVEDGLVRAVGCSNETPHGLMKSLWLADRSGSVRFETIQNNYSLLNRRFDDALAMVAREERVSLLAYSPIAAGVLSGKYLDGAWPEGARFTRYREHDERTRAMTARFVNERTLEATRRIGAIAADCGLSPVTFSVAWLLTRDFLGSALIGVTAPEQLDAHLAASDAALPDDALAACERLAREIPYPLG